MKRAGKLPSFIASFDLKSSKSERGRSGGKSSRRRADLARVADHEAAHAIAAHVLWLHIDEVSVRPGRGYLGRCIGPSPIYGYEVPATRREQSKLARDHAIVLYAGLAAESLRFGVPFTFDDSARHGAWNDHEQAQWLMNAYYSHMNPRSLASVQLKALRLVRMHRVEISRLAEILLERKTIRGAELQRLLEQIMNGTEDVAKRSNLPTGASNPARPRQSTGSKASNGKK